MLFVAIRLVRAVSQRQPRSIRGPCRASAAGRFAATRHFLPHCGGSDSQEATQPDFPMSSLPPIPGNPTKVKPTVAQDGTKLQRHIHEMVFRSAVPQEDHRGELVEIFSAEH